MDGSTITRTSPKISGVFSSDSAIAGLLVAFAPRGATTVDRCLIEASFTIGRSSECDLSIRDDKVSKQHLCIVRDVEGFWIEDLGSTNGTFVDGSLVTRKQELIGPAVIRCGRAILIFHTDMEPLLAPPPAERFGIAGRYHTGPLVSKLHEAAFSERHVLLAGPSGTGKELAAHALASMMGKPGTPLRLIPHNAARFSSAEEASSTLFGVGPKVFSDVDARPGLIEQAGGGALFLDEVHNLPERVQRSLLRVIEDGRLARIGETKLYPTDVRFILASNAPGPYYSMARDLLARLRVIRIPPLAERAADIPAIFEHLLRISLKRQGINEADVIPLLSGDHYEALCLGDFADDNIRGLVDLVDRLVTRIKAGTEPAQAVTTVFAERFGGGPVAGRQTGTGKDAASASRYEQNKDIIIAAYRECGGNLSATVRVLRSKGLRCSRRWLAVFTERWGLRRE